ncbi:MAG: MarR family transcriptional regulator [Rhizobiaceae bacterium]|nr:MarR family transcriptional regulator [Rhizobiaceae bacterium]
MQANAILRDLSASTIFLHQAIADHLGLNVTDHKCLDFLQRRGPLTAGQLADLSGLTTGAITGVVDRLEKKGFVRRTPDPSDRRKTVIVVEPGRMPEIVDLFRMLGDRTDAIMRTYSPQEQDVIIDFLENASRLVDEFVQELKRRDPPK